MLFRSSRETGSKASPREKDAPPPPKKRLGFKEQRELDAMEGNIEKAEGRLAELSLESGRPEVVSNAGRLTEISAEMAKLELEIARMYNRWQELISLSGN